MKNSRNQGIIFLLCILLCIERSYGQDFPDFKFRYLTMKDGLTNDYVTCFTQDKNGFVWMGTANGLNRYDGNRMKQFFHDPQNDNSIPDNYIHHLVTDKNNRIWMCTAKGVSCYDQAKDQFIHYAKDDQGKNWLMDGANNYLYIDKKEELWIASLAGFYTVDKNEQLQKRGMPVWKVGHFIDSVKAIHSIYRDKQGKEWIFTDQYVYQLDAATKQPLLAFKLPFSDMTGIYQDSENNYWITTEHTGLFTFDREKNNFTHFPIPSNEKTIFHITEWNDGKNGWLILPGFSLTLINVKTKQAKSYEPNIYNKRGYQGTFWANLFIDKDNRLWMGYERGVNVMQTHLQKVDIIPLTSPGDIPYQEPAYGLANLIFYDTSGYWINKYWAKIGTYHYDKNWKLLDYYSSVYPLNKEIFNLNSGVYNILRHGEKLYFATAGGLVAFDKSLRNTKLIKPLSTENPAIVSFLKIDNNIVLMRGIGLHVFDMKTEKFIDYFPVEKMFGRANVHFQSIAKGRDGRIYVCAAENLIAQFDPVHKSFSHLQSITNDNHINPNIVKMSADSAGNLWIATNTGVIVFDPVIGKITKTFPENKMMGAVNKLLIDKNQNVWCITRSSIWCYIQNKQKWFSLNSLDGLPSEVYEDNGLIEMPDGSIMTGIGEKAIRFNANYFENEYVVKAPAYITEVHTADSVINLNGKTHKQIELAPNQKSFSVELAVLNYDQPNGIKYYYQLEPSMKEFQENQNSHLTFNDLPHGHYVLRLKGSDKLGNFSDNEDVLEITIKPFWYQTNFFIAGCLLVFASMVYGFFKWRVNSIRDKAALKQQMTETEMQALRAQMNPHFIFNSLNSIENFMMQNEKRLASDYLNKFSRLIRSILDSSRNELVPVAKDMEALQLYMDLEQLRFNNKFSYRISIDPQLMDGDFRVPTLLIQPYVENAIVHGIAHSKQNNLTISITVKAKGDNIQFVIEDNGVGRDEVKRINEKNKPNHKSVGLEITAKRIAHLNKQKNVENAVVITDLFDEAQQACGTRIEILIAAN